MNITCIGALNWDRKLQLLQTLQAGTSNPVRQLAGTAGGVAFNLARCLARDPRVQVQLVSAWGDDPEGQALRKAAAQAQVALLGLLRSGCASGQYTAVLTANAELALALADMHVLDALPDAFWQRAHTAVQESDATVLDLNLTQADLQTLCQVAHAHAKPLALVAVSAPKMHHLPQDLSGVDLLMLNQDELAMLFKPAVADLHGAWQHLRQRGLRTLLVTQGADGVTVCELGGCQHQPAPEPITPTDVTGAGDALSAATLHALWVQGLPMLEAVALGQRAAAVVLTRLESV